jgi:DNA invertase Pin-like site-specific DNA recombinase
VAEKISSGQKLQNRKLFRLLREAKTGDLIIISEISRLGRNLIEIMLVLNKLLNKNINIISIKDNYDLNDGIGSKVLAFAFGLSAEIEKKLIQQRTTEALARLKAEGRILGRPVGVKNKVQGAAVCGDFIIKMIKNGKPKTKIAKKLKIGRSTLYKYIKELGLM